MPTYNQSGMVPPVIILLAVLIGAAGIILFKNLPFGEPQATPDKGAIGALKMVYEEASSSATPSATVKPTTKKSPSPSPKATATPAANSNNNSNNNGNNSSNNDTNNSNNNNQQNTNANNSSPTPAPTSNSSATQDFGSGGINVSTKCNPNLEMYITTNNLYVDKSHFQPPSYDNGVWMVLEDKSTGQKMIYGMVGLRGSGSTQYPVGLNATIPPTGSIRGEGITVSNDGRQYSVAAFVSPATNGYPSLDTKIAEVTFSRKCP